MKTITFCVTSDLATDQRVLRHTKLLHEQGFKVILVGRKKADSPKVPMLPFHHKRIRMVFTQGPLFYAFFNLRLLFFLSFTKTDIIWANDLDTAFPAYFVSILRNKTLVFDAHEIFTEVPELAESPRKKNIWLWIEKHCAAKAPFFITVNHSLANVFETRYGVKPRIIRNVPVRSAPIPEERISYGISERSLIVITQGSGLNHGRGLMESIMAVAPVQEAVLLVVGSGTAIPEAKAYVEANQLTEKVLFVNRLPHHEMMKITSMADVGLAFDTHPCLNYHLALPNKIFDYLQAGIAVVCAQQPEIKHLVHQYHCGIIMEDSSVDSIRNAIEKFNHDRAYLALSKTNSSKAAAFEHWEVEQQKMLELIANLS